MPSSRSRPLPPRSFQHPLPQSRPPECFGREATIVGTPRDELIYGTEGRDVIAALGGKDHVFGEPEFSPTSADLVCAGLGRDVVCEGQDPTRGGSCVAATGKAFGGGGDDLLMARVARGGRGEDELRGADFNTLDLRLYGGIAADTVDGSPEGDELRGGRGRDVLAGYEGRDLITGDGHDDDLYGGENRDTLRGGRGWDWCEAGPKGGPPVGCERTP